MVLGIIALAAIAFLLFTFKDQVKGGLNKAFADKDPAELTQEKEAAASRDAKGAIGNTWDWIFGEGVWQKQWQSAADSAQIGTQDEQAQQQGAPLADSDINPKLTEVKQTIPAITQPQINPLEEAAKGFTDFFGGIGTTIQGGFEGLLQNPKTVRFGGKQTQKPVIRSLLTIQKVNPTPTPAQGVTTPSFSKNETSRGQVRFGSEVSTTGMKQAPEKSEEQVKFLTTPQGFRRR